MEDPFTTKLLRLVLRGVPSIAVVGREAVSENRKRQRPVMIEQLSSQDAVRGATT